MPTLNTSSSLTRADHTLTATTPHHAPAENIAFNRMEKQGFSLYSKAQAAINSSSTEGHAMNCHAIPLKAVELALMTAKMRRSTHGGTSLLAAYTPRLVAGVDCHRGTAPSAATLAHAKREGMRVEQAALMERGHIVDLIKRTRNLHGLPEVRKTFGAGLKELAQEHRFFLNVAQKEVTP